MCVLPPHSGECGYQDSDMWERFCDFWLPRLLFAATLGAAGMLAALVVAAPWLADSQPSVLSLFAGDVVVRRTSLASAAGLVVTAYVFFRPGGVLFFRWRRDKAKGTPPVAGA
jgi:hypothetical protein